MRKSRSWQCKQTLQANSAKRQNPCHNVWRLSQWWFKSCDHWHSDDANKSGRSLLQQCCGVEACDRRARAKTRRHQTGWSATLLQGNASNCLSHSLCTNALPPLLDDLPIAPCSLQLCLNDQGLTTALISVKKLHILAESVSCCSCINMGLQANESIADNRILNLWSKIAPTCRVS